MRAPAMAGTMSIYTMMHIIIVTIYTVNIYTSSLLAEGSALPTAEVRRPLPMNWTEVHRSRFTAVKTNTLTTAHIHDLLFRPGSGAYGSLYAPTTDAPAGVPGVLTSLPPSTTSSATSRTSVSPLSISIRSMNTESYEEKLGATFAS